MSAHRRLRQARPHHVERPRRAGTSFTFGGQDVLLRVVELSGPDGIATGNSATFSGVLSGSVDANVSTAIVTWSPDVATVGAFDLDMESLSANRTPIPMPATSPPSIRAFVTGAAVVPLPSTDVLLASGLFGVRGFACRRRTA